MSDLRILINRKNLVKVIVYSIIIALFMFITFTILALLFGILSGILLETILIGALIFEVLSFCTLFVVLSKFFRSIDTVNDYAELLAEGELNINDIQSKDSFGIELLTKAFSDMIYNLLSFIELTKVNIVTISEAVDSVSKSMETSYTSNEEIAASMENVAEKSQDQAKLMGDTMTRIDEVKTRIEVITQSVEKVEKSVEESVYATTSGMKSLEKYYKQVNFISDNLNNTSEYIKKLNQDIAQIDEIGGFITKTSEQLKLLGLNASVEAAKAGESGKGFSVVAHEMNLLSKATKESIGKIGSIIKNIQNRSEDVSNGIDICVESYDLSKDIFKSIKNSFEIINNSANVLESDIKKVYNEVHLINSRTYEINEKSQQLYKVSEDISYKTKGVSAVSQEELEELQMINTSTLSLKNMLTGIEKLVGRFNTSVVPVEADSKSQLRIAFISPLDNEFWYIVRKGVFYAKKVLAHKNVIIDYYGFDQDVGHQIKETVKEAIKSGVKGIVVTGFDPELVELVNLAYKKNIPVMTITQDLPKKSNRVAYFGPNNDATGAIAVRVMERALKGKGEVVILTEELDTYGRGAIEAEIKKCRGLKVVAHEQCAHSIDISYTVMKDILRKNSNIRAIFALGIGILGAIRAVEESDNIAKPLVISPFYSKEIAEYIQRGIVYVAISHAPFRQGYDPIIYLHNMLITGQKPENEINWTRIEVIDKRRSYELL